MAALTSTPRNWTYFELIKDVLTTEENIIYWLQRKHLLASSMDCPKCSSSCRLVPRKGSLSWRCPRKGCQAVVSVREKSFFSKSRLSLSIILRTMFLWTRQTRVTEAAAETKISKRVAIDWYNFFRDVCIEYYVTHPIVIGGPGKVVEIDESKFTQGIEGHWSCTKRMMRKQGVMNTSSDLFPTYLVEFLWRRRFEDEDLFEKLLEHISEQYTF